MMTNRQIALVKQSWRIFQQIDPLLVGDLFYSKLFCDKPSLRKMFPKDMKAQCAKLIAMLNTMIARLDNLDEISETLAHMANRHVEYGVRPVHYKMVGTALLWTLEKGMGKDWDWETSEAWAACYTILAGKMMVVQSIN